jgi:hypothetical protein
MSSIRLGGVVSGLASLLVAAGLVLSTLSAAQAPQTKPAAQPPAKPADPDAVDPQDLTALSQLVDTASSGQPVPAGAPVTWISNHFIRSQGDSVYIPFTVSVDRAQLPSPSATIYVRAVSKAPGATPPAAGARPTYAWEKIHAIELSADGRVSRAIALPTGAYDIFVAIKEKGAPAAGKIGLVTRDLTVPSFSGSELTTSSVILANGLEQLSSPLPAERQEANPYVYGTLRVIPSLDHKFQRTGELQLVFWVYGASHTGGKPDITVEYSFHQRLPDGTTKYVNRTKPQEMNEKTLPPEFNLTAGHQLLSSLKIPLASFAPGDYRLEIKVTDKPSSKTVTRDVDFQVSA